MPILRKNNNIWTHLRFPSSLFIENADGLQTYENLLNLVKTVVGRERRTVLVAWRAYAQFPLHRVRLNHYCDTMEEYQLKDCTMSSASRRIWCCHAAFRPRALPKAWREYGSGPVPCLPPSAGGLCPRAEGSWPVLALYHAWYLPYCTAILRLCYF